MRSGSMNIRLYLINTCIARMEGELEELDTYNIDYSNLREDIDVTLHDVINSLEELIYDSFEVKALTDIKQTLVTLKNKYPDKIYILKDKKYCKCIKTLKYIRTKLEYEEKKRNTKINWEMI